MTEETRITRTEALLALLVLHNMAEASQIDKTAALNKAGFTNPEIASLLNTTGATVASNLYAAKKSKKAKKKAVKKEPGKKATKKMTTRKTS